MDTTELERRLNGCFGDRDMIFAVHPSDVERARELITDAKEAGVTWDSFSDAMERLIRGRASFGGYTQVQNQHVNEQIERARGMWR